MTRILYITDPIKHWRVSGCLNNYLNDLLFFGLKEIYGDAVVSSNVITPLYRSLRTSTDPRHLWGRGFTGCWLIDGKPSSEQDITTKIADRHYDVVIYGSIRDCDDHFDLVSRAYPPERVLLIDGNDDTDIHPAFGRHCYFKRELVQTHPKLLPISFAIPTPKLCTANEIRKTKTFATCFPGNKATYIFQTEEDYYSDYRASLFAFTMKKHGWDCMRHYEILANRCVPLFFDLQQCPHLTMVTFPRDLCDDALNLFRAFQLERYIQLESALFSYATRHLTTRTLGSFVMSHAS
jgi:hypothetical protein